jgi:acetyl-CoA acetyltransferase
MSKVNDDLVFVAAKRTPFGTFGGSLSKVSATDLAVQASQACLDQASLKGENEMRCDVRIGRNRTRDLRNDR